MSNSRVDPRQRDRLAQPLVQHVGVADARRRVGVELEELDLVAGEEGVEAADAQRAASSRGRPGPASPRTRGSVQLLLQALVVGVGVAEAVEHGATGDSTARRTRRTWPGRDEVGHQHERDRVAVEDDVVLGEPGVDPGLELGAAVAELGELDQVLELEVADLVGHHRVRTRFQRLRFLAGATRPLLTGRSNRVESTTWVSVRMHARGLADPLERLLEVLGVASRARAGSRWGRRRPCRRPRPRDSFETAALTSRARHPAPRRRARRRRGCASRRRRLDRGGVAADHAVGLEPVDAALDRGRRQRHPLADVLEGAAGVLAQQRNDLLVGFVGNRHIQAYDATNRGCQDPPNAVIIKKRGRRARQEEHMESEDGDRTRAATATRRSPKNDEMPLLGIDHVELYVGNAVQAAHFFTHALGFRETAFAGPRDRHARPLLPRGRAGPDPLRADRAAARRLRDRPPRRRPRRRRQGGRAVGARRRGGLPRRGPPRRPRPARSRHTSRDEHGNGPHGDDRHLRRDRPHLRRARRLRRRLPARASSPSADERTTTACSPASTTWSATSSSAAWRSGSATTSASSASPR